MKLTNKESVKIDWPSFKVFFGSYKVVNDVPRKGINITNNSTVTNKYTKLRLTIHLESLDPTGGA